MRQLPEASSACQVTPHLSQGPPASLYLAAPGDSVGGCPGTWLGADLRPIPTSHSPTPLLFPHLPLGPAHGLPFPRELELGPLF